MTAALEGTCDPRFAAVREALAGNLAERGELGASVAVVVEGRLVVDLWAGWVDEERTRPWQRDTLVNVFSVGKGVASLAALRLLERGALSLDERVSRYWPEFAAAGKGDVTVRMLFGHQAGLPAIHDPLPDEAIYDWKRMTSTLAAETPWWEPGRAHGYHVNTFGFLIGELVRRVSGESIGSFVRREIAAPLGADFHFGVGPADEPRVADYFFGTEIFQTNRPSGTTSAERKQLLGRVYMNPSGISGMGTVNTHAWRAAEMPSTNGHANARAVARIYGALAGDGLVDGIRLLAPETIALARSQVSAGTDFVLGKPSRFGLGFQLASAESTFGPSPNAFGHGGAGGSVGFADPDARLSFAYAMNLAGPRYGSPRTKALVDAVYASL